MKLELILLYRADVNVLVKNKFIARDSFSLPSLLFNVVSVDELRNLLSNKDAYQNLLYSLEPIKTQNRAKDELRNETLQLAKNLKKEPHIMELINQNNLNYNVDYCSREVA
ncbi:hypothetical protein ACS0TY_004004 [Phlomoides rotata]